MTEYIHTPEEVLEYQREAIEAAETKEEAYEAIDLVLRECAIHGRRPAFIEGLAEELPLTTDEIHERLKTQKYELDRLYEERVSRDGIRTTVVKQGGTTLIVDDIEFCEVGNMREMHIAEHDDFRELRRRHHLSGDAGDFYAALGEVLNEG